MALDFTADELVDEIEEDPQLGLELLSEIHSALKPFECERCGRDIGPDSDLMASPLYRERCQLCGFAKKFNQIDFDKI